MQNWLMLLDHIEGYALLSSDPEIVFLFSQFSARPVVVVWWGGHNGGGN